MAAGKSTLAKALTAHILALLAKNISDVLDFPANTTRQREWFRQIIDQGRVDHELHFVDSSNDLCIAQLRPKPRHNLRNRLPNFQPSPEVHHAEPQRKLSKTVHR